MDVETVSADVTAESINAIKLSFDTVSGNVALNALKIADSIEIHTVSGDSEITLSKELMRLNVESTSGNLKVIAPCITACNIETVSGDSSFNFEKAPSYFDAESTSGNFKLTIPESSSFKLSFESASGDFNSEIEATKQGEFYISGDGKATYEFETASGNLNLYKYEQVEK